MTFQMQRQLAKFRTNSLRFVRSKTEGNAMFTKIILVAAAVMAIAGLAPPADAKCGGSAGQISRSTGTTAATTSTTFVDVPLTSTDVTLFPDLGCVAVTLWAETLVPRNEAIFVQAVLDDITVGEPGPVTWAAAEGTPIHAVFTFKFLIRNGAAGPHTVKLQWRSQNGKQIKFTNRTMTAEIG
jgi:hypothetical protein